MQGPGQGMTPFTFRLTHQWQYPDRNGIVELGPLYPNTPGSIVVGIGYISHWFLLVIGGILLFSVAYDRCPIWKAITTQFRKAAVK